MIQRDCLDVTLTMRDGNKCRKISISYRTRINYYMYRLGSHEAAYDSDSEGQQQVSRAVRNRTSISLRAGSEYEMDIRRFQLRNLSGREHEYLIQKAKKRSKNAKLCFSRLLEKCLNLAARRQLQIHANMTIQQPETDKFAVKNFDQSIMLCKRDQILNQKSLSSRRFMETLAISS